MNLRLIAVAWALLLGGCARFDLEPRGSGAEAPLTVSPDSRTVGPRTRVTFRLSGGRPPYHATLEAGSGPAATLVLSGATVDYQAGDVPRSKDLLSFADEGGQSAEAQVDVGPPLSVTPGEALVAWGASATFSVEGGEPPYRFVAERGTVVADGAAYRYTAPKLPVAAPPSEDLDHVAVLDSAGERAQFAARLPAPLRASALPSPVGPGGQARLSAQGGVPPYLFRFAAPGNASGGEIVGDLYTAGINPNVVDHVEAVDASGAAAPLDLAVGPPRFALGHRQLIDGDFDGNGLPDLLALDPSDTDPRMAFIADSVSRGPSLVADVSVRRSVRFGLQETRSTALDVNGDGADDVVALVAPTLFTRELIVYLGGPGGPGPVAQVMPLRSLVDNVQALDMDNDGRRESVVFYAGTSEDPSCPAGSLVVLRAAGGMLQRQSCYQPLIGGKPLSSSSLPVRRGRFEGGAESVALLGYTAAFAATSVGYATVANGAFTGYVASGALSTTANGAAITHTLARGGLDLNGDGADDVIVLQVNSSTNEVSPELYLSSCPAGTCQIDMTKPLTSTLKLGDVATQPELLKLDGRQLLAFLPTVASPAQVLTLEFRDGAVKRGPDLPVVRNASAWFEVTAGDVDGDGRTDLAVADDRALTLLIGDGVGGFQAGDRRRVAGAQAVATAGPRFYVQANTQLQGFSAAGGHLYFERAFGVEAEFVRRVVSAVGQVVLWTSHFSYTVDAQERFTVKAAAPFTEGDVLPFGGSLPYVGVVFDSPALLRPFQVGPAGLTPLNDVPVDDNVNAVVDLNADGRPDAVAVAPDGTVSLERSDPAAKGFALLPKTQLGRVPAPSSTTPATLRGALALRTRPGQATPDQVAVGVMNKNPGAPSWALAILDATSSGGTVLPINGALDVVAASQRINMAAADFDHDGFTDLVVAGLPNLYFLYGSEKGLTAPKCRRLGVHSTDLIALEADGRDGADLVAVDAPSESVFLLNGVGRVTGACP